MTTAFLKAFTITMMVIDAVALAFAIAVLTSGTGHADPGPQNCVNPYAVHCQPGFAMPPGSSAYNPKPGQWGPWGYCPKRVGFDGC